MNDIFFISDLHFGHKNLKKFVPWIKNISHEEYIEQSVARWNSVVKRGDSVWVLGDVAKNTAGLITMNRLNGQKNLIRGNHDIQETLGYLKFFQCIHGIVKRYGFWISHCPIHPAELREHKNIHGHVHQNELDDPNYIYVGSDKLEGYPISLDEIKRKYGDK